MNSDQTPEQWNQIKGNLQSFFSKLTDEDITSIDGSADKLLVALQKRYGYREEQAQDQWDKFTRRYGHVNGLS